MKIAVLGGGITGLVASYYLAKSGHKITLIEKEKNLGGLASGFKADGWDWYLERTYHHLFKNDSDILDFSKEIGFNRIFFKDPITSSLYYSQNKFTDIPLDTPVDLLRFPYLGIIDKLRAGFVLAFLKVSPFLPLYGKETSEDFLKKTMGKNSWNMLWQQLFRKKYGDYAGIILASFIWARVNKRTKSLGYIEGGFQTLINFVEKKLRDMNVKINKGMSVDKIDKRGNGFIIGGEEYDAVISTLPTAIFSRLATGVFTKDYLSKFEKLKYLHAVNLVLETDVPILDRTYWLNICTKKIPIMVMACHTNFIDRKNYGGKNLTYLGWYVKRDDPLIKMSDSDILKYAEPYVKKISSSKFKVTNYYVFKAPWAQPIFDKEFVENKPTFKTPVKNFYIANLDMTYPYDRGTNYAVKLGRDISQIVR